MIHICKETETFVGEELGQHEANLLLFGTHIGHHLPGDPAISSIKGSPGRSGRLWGVPRVAIPSQDWLPRLKKHRLEVFSLSIHYRLEISILRRVISQVFVSTNFLFESRLTGELEIIK